MLQTGNVWAAYSWWVEPFLEKQRQICNRLVVPDGTDSTTTVRIVSKVPFTGKRVMILDLVWRTALFVVLTFGTAAIMALPYIA